MRQILRAGDFRRQGVTHPPKLQSRSFLALFEHPIPTIEHRNLFTEYETASNTLWIQMRQCLLGVRKLTESLEQGCKSMIHDVDCEKAQEDTGSALLQPCMQQDNCT
jgi:hypothetical protein